MDQLPEFEPDLDYLDRRMGAVRRSLVPGVRSFIMVAVLMPAIGIALGFVLAEKRGGFASSPVLIGAVGAVIALLMAAAREKKYGQWYRGELALGVVLDFTFRSDNPDEPDRAVVLLSTNDHVWQSAPELLELHQHVLAWFDEGEGSDEDDRRGMTLHEWLDRARRQRGLPAMRVPRRVSGDSQTWLVNVPMWPESMPPGGDEGVVLTPVLMAGSKAAPERGNQAFLGCLLFVLGPLPAVLAAAFAETRMVNVRQPHLARAVPRVRPIPYRFWNEQAAVQSRLHSMQ